jgi:hypothetical protein
VKEVEVFEIADETAFRTDIEKCANGRLFHEREQEMQPLEQPGNSASGKATNTRGGCSWRTSSRGRRGECRMCSREEDERLVEVEGGECGN